MQYSGDLNYFLGKPCTFMIAGRNPNLQETINYFTAIPYTIDERFIWAEHVVTGRKNCYNLAAIDGIIEEQALFPDNPEDKKIIDQYRKEKPELAEATTINGARKFVKLADLQNLAKQHSTS